MKKTLVLVAVVLMLAIPATATAKDGWRTWKVSYNAALSLHEAAVPSGYAKPGDHLKIVYHGRTLRVHAVPGGCTCFDISDEGMNHLADTSKGVIRAKVKKVG